MYLNFKVLACAHYSSQCDMRLSLALPLSPFQEHNLDWFPRMRAMSLVSSDAEGEQNEIRNLQEKLESTMKLVSNLSSQLTELKEQVESSDGLVVSRCNRFWVFTASVWEYEARELAVCQRHYNLEPEWHWIFFSRPIPHCIDLEWISI